MSENINTPIEEIKPSWHSVIKLPTKRPFNWKVFLFLALLVTGVFGVFLSLDLFLFFFERVHDLCMQAHIDIAIQECCQTFDLDEVVREQIYFSLPMKSLCRKDCSGLCPLCGANLNMEECKCRKEKGHPGFSELKNLKLKKG